MTENGTTDVLVTVLIRGNQITASQETSHPTTIWETQTRGRGSKTNIPGRHDTYHIVRNLQVSALPCAVSSTHFQVPDQRPRAAQNPSPFVPYVIHPTAFALFRSIGGTAEFRG